MINVTAKVGAKGHVLYQRGAVHIRSSSPDFAVVHGDSGWYDVRATPSGPTCTCKAWKPRRACSHVAAALIAWGAKVPPSGSPAAHDRTADQP